MENTHKYQIKVPFIEQIGNSPKAAQSVNYSKTLGSNNNWIGCGYIDREGKTKKHNNVSFPYFSLVFVLEGKGTYIDSQDQLHHLEKGSIFLRRPGYRHSSYCESQPPWKEYYIDCNLSLYNHFSSILIPDNNVTVFKAICVLETIDKFSELMDFIKNASTQDLPNIYIKFMALLAHIFNNTVDLQIFDESDTINQVKTDLDNLCHQRIDLKVYCENQSLNYEVFRKKFKEQTGLTLNNYMIRCRLNRACTLLRTTTTRISEISNELGYSSQYEFSNQFKRYFNLSPKQYRTGAA
ncbi:AraC family transcriptional regulator [Buttiauxella sp. WJP83]|uniref:AraC family transcriptional regulator n=1 Tax=Buttiauxella sp. WJP83 TaxID=2986951 RepID=UPI0022DE7A99|nr:AraC family transcriptional regulator [Buttiauxella sp. WJP83]WBM70766.1 AraC family transcriptional regulator [Buttiauxella sp. WJP83]